jgi:hypothetical protein
MAGNKIIMVPTEEQMVCLVAARLQHQQDCKFSPTYDMSGELVALRCVCGWSYELRTDGANE